MRTQLFGKIKESKESYAAVLIQKNGQVSFQVNNRCFNSSSVRLFDCNKEM